MGRRGKTENYRNPVQEWENHHRRDNGTYSFCYLCPEPKKPIEVTQEPPDDVYDLLLEELNIKSVINNNDCKKFHKWSVEKVRRFWNFVNANIWLKTGTKQTILDDYLQV